MKKGKKDFRNKLFIKDLENITGIKAHTIRIWEQRYHIFTPHRTDTGIRYYDEDQLRLILPFVRSQRPDLVHQQP